MRWRQENQGWNHLRRHWAFKHGFLHACKHRTRRLAASGRRQPVPHRRLAAVALIQCLASVLSSACALLHCNTVCL